MAGVQTGGGFWLWLNLLASLGVIALRPGAGITPTALDITANPKKMRIVELTPALSRSRSTTWMRRSSIPIGR